jgi:hypothetical protein
MNDAGAWRQASAVSGCSQPHAIHTTRNGVIAGAARCVRLKGIDRRVRVTL